jgi:UDP-N-acetylglucosamine 2-epimerase (non-hydrolysing)/UDP-GlcNAc3NAcA epimerase
MDSPEEVNRILTDHCSSLLLCATRDAKDKLKKENLGDKAHVVGNIMYDSFLHFANKPWDHPEVIGLDGNPVVIPEEFYFMTCHRQENTYSDEPLTEILAAMDSLDAPTIYAVHPRNHERAKRVVANNGFKNIILTQPVKYSDSVQLVSRAKKVVTDSGGLQCEAFYAGVQCVLVLDYVVWPETMVYNRNQLAKPNKEDILEKLSAKQYVDKDYKPFGDGHAAEKITQLITEFFENRK